MALVDRVQECLDVPSMIQPKIGLGRCRLKLAVSLQVAWEPPKELGRQLININTVMRDLKHEAIIHMLAQLLLVAKDLAAYQLDLRLLLQSNKKV
jgi:hypothetical protein